MGYCGMTSITNLCSVSIQKILKQDKKWFDMQRHSPSDIVLVVVKDGDDARNLVSVVWVQFSVVVGAMLGVGLVWALVRTATSAGKEMVGEGEDEKDINGARDASQALGIFFFYFRSLFTEYIIIITYLYLFYHKDLRKY
jgi:hypothetical protein